MHLDMVIRGGTVVSASETRLADVGILEGRIAAVAPNLSSSAPAIDATGLLVLPGGIDSHTHIEQISSAGVMTADDFYSATVAAAFGGTTTTLSFAAQHRGMRIPDVLADYHARAAEKAVIDYGFHLIVANPCEQTLAHDLPAAIKEGVGSFKLFMTYDRLLLTDEQILDVLAIARRHGALTMVHAENHGMIRWLSGRLINAGMTRPKYHGLSHSRGAEAEAIGRVIALAELADAPILIVHVSTEAGIETIRQAQARGLKVFAETCPQYLLLTSADLDRAGLDGAMFCCSPPPRDAAAQSACWRGLKDGTLSVYSSDHAPYRFDATGKLPKGEQTTFKDVANGVPGIELRMALLFSEGVSTGRMNLQEFVRLTATEHAKIYGLYPRKGDIVIGADADLGLWNPHASRTVRSEMLHDAAGYSPYEGRSVSAWPETVISRGEVIVQSGRLLATRGRGKYLPRVGLPSATPLNRHVPEIQALKDWGHSLPF